MRFLGWVVLGSIEGKTYDVQRGTNLLPSSCFTNRQSDIVGLAGVTVYTDAVQTAGSPCFYRIRVGLR